MTLKEKRAEIKTLKWCRYHQMIEWLWASSDKEQKEDFLGDPAIGNLPANAGDRFSLLHRKIPHTQLGPMCHNYWSFSLGSLWALQQESALMKLEHGNQKVPLLPTTRESSCTAVKIQLSQNKYIKIKKCLQRSKGDLPCCLSGLLWDSLEEIYGKVMNYIIICKWELNPLFQLLGRWSLIK